MRTIETKEDVQHHSDGYRDGHPAVNIKLYGLWDDVKRVAAAVARDEHGADDADVSRFTAWLESLEDEPYEYPSALDIAHEWAARWGIEQLQDDACEIWSGRKIELYQEGRSGGWLVVHGLPEIEEWDAVMLAKWRRFTRYVQDALDYFPSAVAGELYANAYEVWKEADDQKRAVAYARTDREVLA